MIIHKILFFILITTVVTSSTAQGQKRKNSGFCEVGVSGNGGFLKNENGDFKFGTGTGFFWNISFCFGNHCFGLTLGGGDIVRGGSEESWRPGDVNTAYFTVPPFSYRYKFKPFFVEVSPQLLIIDLDHQSGFDDLGYAVSVRGGITKDFGMFRIGVSLGVIASPDIISGNINVFTGLVFK